MSTPALKYISAEEYLLIERDSAEKHEYADGQVIDMAGASEEHNRIVANLLREIGSFLKDKNCDVFPSDFRVATPSSDAYMYPDVSIVCGAVQKKQSTFDTLTNPAVIIEVMSLTTKSSDRGYKFFYYQQIPSLKEYILIDSNQCFVQTIRRQPDDSWKFTKTEDMNASLFIETITAQFLLKDIYYKVSLP